MVAVPPVECRNGADGQHLFPSGRRRLVGRLLEGVARPSGLLHSRNDPCLAGSNAGPLLFAVDAPSVLSLRLSAPAWKAVRVVRPRAAGRARRAPLSRRSGLPGACDAAARTASVF